MTNILPAIDGITIRQHDGLFSLTDLHKASGGESRHQPAFFLRREETKALVCEISQSANSQIAVKTERLGEDRGTYACRELVIAYAAWISPAFHLKVIRVFLAAAAPAPQPLPPLPYKEQPGQSLSEPQCAELRSMLTGACAQVPEDMRGQFMVQGWSRLKAHFGCTYRHIPAARFEEARDIISRHIAAFLPAPAAAPTLDPFDRTAFLQAREWAEDWMAETRRRLQQQPRRRLDEPALAASDAISDEVLCGIIARAFSGKRFVVDFISPHTPARVTLLPAGAATIEWAAGDVHELIAHNLPADKVPATIAALAYRNAPALLAAPQAA